MSCVARENALHYIVEGISTKHRKHRDEAWKASESHIDRRFVQFAEFVLKIAPIRGLKFGIAHFYSYLCIVNPERHQREAATRCSSLQTESNTTKNKERKEL